MVDLNFVVRRSLKGVTFQQHILLAKLNPDLLFVLFTSIEGCCSTVSDKEVLCVIDSHQMLNVNRQFFNT